MFVSIRHIDGKKKLEYYQSQWDLSTGECSKFHGNPSRLSVDQIGGLTIWQPDIA